LVEVDPEKYTHRHTAPLWEGEYTFPSGLKKLDLRGLAFLDDKFALALPQGIDFMDFQSALGLTDIAIPALSRFVTVLDLGDATLITSRSFKEMPPLLWFLSLAKCEKIYDETFSICLAALNTSISERPFISPTHVSRNCLPP
jgi:hypothetical protein